MTFQPGGDFSHLLRPVKSRQIRKTLTLEGVKKELLFLACIKIWKGKHLGGGETDIPTVKSLHFLLQNEDKRPRTNVETFPTKWHPSPRMRNLNPFKTFLATSGNAGKFLESLCGGMSYLDFRHSLVTVWLLVVFWQQDIRKANHMQ